MQRSGAERATAAPADTAVAIAASRGGIEALRAVLGGFPADFPAAVLVVLHMQPDRASQLPAVLAPHCALAVRAARDGEAAAAGVVLVAVPDKHLTIRPDRTLSLAHGDRVHFACPAADPLFTSLARAYGRDGIAVVLTGSGDDGTAGACAVSRAGGRVLAQDPGAAVAPSMPASAIAAGCVARVLPLNGIAPHLLHLLRSAHTG